MSFILPAYNEERYIGGTIDAIRAAMKPVEAPYEIIVAADGCTDQTAAIAESCGARVVAHERRQISATRNLGARAAVGDVFVFVDADTRISAAVAAQVMEALRSGVVAGGAPVELDGPLPLYAKILMVVLGTIFRWANLAGGAFVFCTRAAYEGAGGWDEAYFAGEEIYFVRALKRQGRFKLVRAPVLTSGRKVRTHSARELLGLFWRGVLSPSMVKDRSRLAFFYGPRREDPYLRP